MLMNFQLEETFIIFVGVEELSTKLFVQLSFISNLSS